MSSMGTNSGAVGIKAAPLRFYLKTSFVGLVLALTLGVMAHGMRYALIIGINDYPGEDNDLVYSTNDAIAIADVLLRDEKWCEENVFVLLDAGATKEVIADVLFSLAGKVSTDDLLLLYFSGHGAAAPEEPPYDELDGYDEYICAYGSALGEFIRDDELSEWLNSITVGTLVVVLDTCYSGGHIRSPFGKPKALRTGYQIRVMDDFVSDLKRLELQPKDLGDLEKKIVVLTSSAENELSWELGPPFNHGLFTYYLLEAMEGNADIEGNNDGAVSAEECYRYLEPRVREISDMYRLNQRPQLFDQSPGETVFMEKFPAVCELQEKVLTAGWHMISVPGDVCGANDPEAVFGDDVSPLYLFHFDPQAGRYKMYPPSGELVISPGKGYWIRLYDMAILDVDLRRTSESLATIALSPGWNQIGHPLSLPVPISALQVRYKEQELSLLDAQARDWVSGYLFRYDPIKQRYEVVDPMEGCLEPWRGYWMRAYVDCELVIPLEQCQEGGMTAHLKSETMPEARLELPPLPPAAPVHGDLLRVVTIPNPVRDVNTAIFRVLGICPCRVQGIRVEIYDLAGRLVWRGEDEGSVLTWHIKGLDGMPLANGVYLYKAYVKVENEWVLVGVQKVAVYR